MGVIYDKLANLITKIILSNNIANIIVAIIAAIWAKLL